MLSSSIMQQNKTINYSTKQYNWQIIESIEYIYICTNCIYCIVYIRIISVQIIQFNEKNRIYNVKYFILLACNISTNIIILHNNFLYLRSNAWVCTYNVKKLRIKYKIKK